MRLQRLDHDLQRLRRSRSPPHQPQARRSTTLSGPSLSPRAGCVLTQRAGPGLPTRWTLTPPRPSRSLGRDCASASWRHPGGIGAPRMCRSRCGLGPLGTPWICGIPSGTTAALATLAGVAGRSPGRAPLTLSPRMTWIAGRIFGTCPPLIGVGAPTELGSVWKRLGGPRVCEVLGSAGVAEEDNQRHIAAVPSTPEPARHSQSSDRPPPPGYHQQRQPQQ